MIGNLKETTTANREQDWLKTNLAQLSGRMQGQRDLRRAGGADHERAGPAGSGAAGRCSSWPHDGDPLRAAPPATAFGQYGRRPAVRDGRVAGRAGRRGEADDPLVDRPARTTSLISSGPRLGAAVRPDRAAGAVPGRGARRHRAGLGRPSSPTVHQRPAGAAARRPSASPSTRSMANSRTDALLLESQRLAQELRARSEQLQAQQERAAAVQHRAGREGRAAGPAEQRHRAQEHRDRAGPPGAGGTRRAAGAGLALQVRVHGEHVARAAHAAEQPADPGEAAGRQPRSQPDRQAGRVRPHHPRGRQRPAPADQRHPGPGQGRGRALQLEQMPGVGRRPGGLRRDAVPAADRGEGPGLRGRRRPAVPGERAHRRAPASADPAQPAVQRGEVHRRRAASG